MKAILDLLPNLLVHMDKNELGEEVVLHGARALPVLQQKAENADTMGTLTFEDLSPFHTYQWLLEKSDKARVDALTEKMLAKVKATCSTLKRTTLPKESPSSYKKKSKGSIDRCSSDEEVNVSSLFN